MLCVKDNCSELRGFHSPHITYARESAPFRVKNLDLIFIDNANPIQNKRPGTGLFFTFKYGTSVISTRERIHEK